MPALTTQARMEQALTVVGHYGYALAESPRFYALGMIGCVQKLCKQLKDHNIGLREKATRAKLLKKCLKGYRAFLVEIADPDPIIFDFKKLLFAATTFARTASKKSLKNLTNAIGACRPARQMRRVLAKAVDFSGEISECVRRGPAMNLPNFADGLEQRRLRRQLAQKKAQLRDKDAEIAGKDRDLAQKETLVGNLRTVIARKNAEMADLKGQIDRMKTDLDDAMKSNGSLAAQAFRMANTLDALQTANPVPGPVAPATIASNVSTAAPLPTSTLCTVAPVLPTSIAAPVLSTAGRPVVSLVPNPALSTPVSRPVPVASVGAPVLLATPPVSSTISRPVPASTRSPRMSQLLSSAPTKAPAPAPAPTKAPAPAAPSTAPALLPLPSVTVSNPLVLSIPAGRRCRSCSPYPRVLGGGAKYTPEKRNLSKTLGDNNAGNTAKRCKSVDDVAEDQSALQQPQPQGAVSGSGAQAAAIVRGQDQDGSGASGAQADSDRRKDRKRRSSGAEDSDTMEDGEPDLKRGKSAVAVGVDGKDGPEEMDCGQSSTAPQPILSQVQVPADGEVDVEMDDDLALDQTQPSDRDTGKEGEKEKEKEGEKEKEKEGEKKDQPDVKLPRRRSRGRDDEETSREQEEAIQKALDEEEDD